MVAAACGSAEPEAIALEDGGLPIPSAEGGEVAGVSGEPVTFTYESFEGESLSFDDFPDGPVVVNFFASWCATCIAEMPDFETTSQNLAGDVSFLGLAMNDRVENAVELVADTGVTYAVGNDQNGDVFAQFGGLGMPTTVFINADRTIASVHSGVLDVESLTEIITDELLS